VFIRNRGDVLLIIQHRIRFRKGVLCDAAKPAHEAFEDSIHIGKVAVAEDASPGELKALHLGGQLSQGVGGHRLPVQMDQWHGGQQTADCHLWGVIQSLKKGEQQSQHMHLVHVAACFLHRGDAVGAPEPFVP